MKQDNFSNPCDRRILLSRERNIQCASGVVTYARMSNPAESMKIRGDKMLAYWELHD